MVYSIYYSELMDVFIGFQTELCIERLCNSWSQESAFVFRMNALRKCLWSSREEEPSWIQQHQKIKNRLNDKRKKKEKTCCPCNMVAWQLAVNRASPTSLKMTGGLATFRRRRIKYGETANRAGCLVNQRRKKIADQDGLSDDRRQTWRPFNPNPLCVPKQMTKRRKANKSKQEKFEKMIR